MPATFIAKTNGEDQYFTVLPMWDPVYVQPRGCNPDFTRLIVDMPFFAMRNGFRGSNKDLVKVASSREMRLSETPGSG
ncbi:hypothetical protein CGCF415_v011048 [Colletotrichum fructicola]|nr:hypothetical protein CGCFRS4_v005109 [Colletotrichum fructicola]KAF4897832.1 hypothetical protein CGCF415_v011048 [Colletotrichum fructicola]KAF4937412.1 hypothetical protein CGCF245_v005654 [Colletotrichum fructicola]